MTRRIINLIAQGVPAERILGLTFTRKAASELLSRVSAAVLADGGDEALKKPLIHIPTVDGLAYNLCYTDRIICPIMDARRKSGIYWYLSDGR